MDTATEVAIVMQVNSRAWEGANVDKCAHALFPEVSESETCVEVVVSLVANMAEVYRDVQQGISPADLPPGYGPEDVMISSAEHALIIAMAVGMGLGRAQASEELASFIVPEFPFGDGGEAA